MSDSTELVLPRFVGSREAARELLNRLGDVRGNVVILNLRSLRSASPSAVDEFVKHSLLVMGAGLLEVIAADDDFAQDLNEAIADHDVADRVRQASLH